MIVAIVAIVALGLFGYFVAWPRWIRPELHHIVSDLTSTVDKLERFIENKSVQVADHLEEIALHQSKMNLKQADMARAERIRTKLNELLS